MIEKWLKEDIQGSFDRDYNRFVISDSEGNAGFLLEYMPKEWIQYQAHSDKEELKAKYLSEKNHKDDPVVFYTTIPVDKLTFLMEYAMIHGHLDLSQFHQYIKKKAHIHVGLNLNISKEELLTAAKVSIGKEKSYWMDLGHKGAGEIFDLKTMLPDFLHQPKQYFKQMDKQVSEAFAEKVQKLIGQSPMKKPAATLAKEVMNNILSGLAFNEIDSTLLGVYRRMIDSATYHPAFREYLGNFKLPKSLDIWKVHYDHPFRQIDQQQLKDVIQNLTDKEFLEKKKPYLKQRSRNKFARIMEILWWEDVLALIDFDASSLNPIASFKELMTYYTQTFYKLDRNIRKLYAEFLSEPQIIQPIQEKYEAWLQELMAKWFEHFKDYKQDQQGLLSSIIRGQKGKTAIIVGDGISYELAKAVNNKLVKSLKVEEKTILADLPSVTDNNMSRLYMEDGSFSEQKKEREALLEKDFPDKKFMHVYLEDINQSTSDCDVLLCSFKDLDDLGEKLQQKALKYIDSIIDTLGKKILELEKIGFNDIFLISDHGFVLTGLLGEADKLEFQPKGKCMKAERFIACSENQYVTKHLLQLEKEYKEYQHLIFSKNLRPFKTPGVYGYSHGGASPQELIIPFFKYTSTDISIQLEVAIANKKTLMEVEGNNFEIRVKASASGGDLFTNTRKCKLSVFAENDEIASSDSFIIEADKEIKREFSFEKNKSLQIYLIDAETKEQIDKVKVKRASGRDFGGLI